MTTRAPYPDVDSIGPGIGGLIEGHLERTFRRVRTPLAEHDPRFLRVITGAPHPFGNFAVVSDPGDVGATREAIGALCERGVPAAALFVGGVVPGVDAVLREAGFEPHGDLPAMAVDIERLPPAPAPAGCVLERFLPGAREEEWIDAFAAGYEIPRAAAALFAPGAMDAGTGDDEAVQFFGALRGGELVATSALVLDDGVAGIYCVSTLPAERGKGLGAFATVEPLRIAHELGYRVAVLQSSEAGYGVYVRLGFADYGAVPLYVRIPG